MVGFVLVVIGGDGMGWVDGDGPVWAVLVLLVLFVLVVVAQVVRVVV